MNINNVLNQLKKERPIFHNEADFQHALAWKIHEMHKDFNIRLEKQIDRKNIDIWVIDKKNNTIYAFELKYKTKKSKEEIQDNSEIFYLKDHAAFDQGRYDYIKDIRRLEEVQNYLRVKSNNALFYGYAIFLTNDARYWDPNRRSSKKSNDEKFRIHMEARLFGHLSWDNKQKASVTKEREDTISLDGNYLIRNDYWQNYNEQYGFKYLLIQLKNEK